MQETVLADGPTTVPGAANDSKRTASHKQTPSELYESFVKFIADNWDYNVESALLVLLSYGMLDLYLHVASARQLVDEALDQAVVHGCAGPSNSNSKP